MLLLELPRRYEGIIGRILWVSLEPGLYGYVGSALGPGGLAARLGRHASTSKRRHWHIDHLLPHAQLLGALIIESRYRLECTWAAWAHAAAIAQVNGFGASDCRCNSHLFYLGPSGDIEYLVEHAAKGLQARYLEPRSERISGYRDSAILAVLR